MKKILLIPSLLTIGLAPMISMVSCNNGVKPRDITLNKTTLNLEVGQTVKLTATVEPAEASQEVEWSSSNPDVCTVENGEVKAIAAGKANITAKPKGYEIPAVCIVNVDDEPTKEIVLNQYYDDGAEGARLQTKTIHTIQPSTKYDFIIDMTKWTWSGDNIHHFTFTINEQDTLRWACPLTNDFEFKIGDVTLNGELGEGDMYCGNIDFNDEDDWTKILGTNYIHCYINTDAWVRTTPRQCYFYFDCIADF